MAKPLPPHYPHLPIFVPIIYCIFAITFCLGLKDADAADLVSGKYLSMNGTTIVLSLSIKNPSPVNLIVEQYLSPGNSITGTSPQAKKIDKAQGKAKWLFRNTHSGNLTLSIQLKEPLKGSASAMIRYRDPNSGAFTELQILP